MDPTPPAEHPRDASSEDPQADPGGGSPRRGASPWPRRLAWLSLGTLPLHGALLWASRSAPEWVEALYGRRLYPAISAAEAALDRLCAPLSPALLLLALLLCALAWSARGSERPLRRFAWRLLVASALVGHAFPICWGWGYWRPALLERVGVATRVPSRSELQATGTLLSGAINGAWIPWPEVVERADLDARVDAAVLAFLGQEGLDEAARARRIRFLPPGAMYSGGWTGVTIPWTTEGWVDPAVDPRVLPIIIAHEKAHQAGFARESDANLIAFLALVRAPDPDLRYAALFDMAPLFGAQVPVPLAPAVQADVQAAVAQEQAVRVESVEAATEVVYDAYLKANAVEGGIEDYDYVARLVQLWLAAHPEDRAHLQALATPGG